MIVWICTDMEGLAGIDDPRQFQPEHTDIYRNGLEHLTDEANAAIAGCYEGGATEVRIIDGHGLNDNKGLLRDRIDPRATIVSMSAGSPIRLEKLDETVTALLMIGQHAMAGTTRAFYDHTGMSKILCRFMINGQEQGELGQAALYAGHYNIPLVYASGDEALCAEAHRLFPHVRTTATKRGTGWVTCELYPVQEVRLRIRHEVATALQSIPRNAAWRPSTPIRVDYEFAWSELADRLSQFAGMERWHARGVGWHISDARDVYSTPGDNGWLPMTN